MKKTILALIGGMSILLLGIVVMQRHAGTQPEENKISVAASFYPLAHFAEQVGGERVTVTNLTPAGAEPHDYEPTPRDIIRLQDAKLILLNGADFEPWFASIKDAGNIPGTIVTMTDYITVFPSYHEETHEEDTCAPHGFRHEDHCDCDVGYRADGLTCVEDTGESEHLPEEEHTHEHTHGAYDPHIWLDPIRAQEEVVQIRNALITIDPSNRTAYEVNAAAYTNQLTALDTAYRTGLQSCRVRTVIAPHNAFQYLGNRYNIEFVSIAGLSPDDEPAAQRLAELANIAKERGVKKIFFETLTSPRLAETIASEAGITTGVLNPIEGLTQAELAAGETYLTVMQKNLEALQAAMECS